MRFLVIGLSAAILALPLAAPASACEGYAAADVSAATDDGTTAMAQAAPADTAAKKKPEKKKMAMKKKKPKVEYMRAAPMPPGAK